MVLTYWFYRKTKFVEKKSNSFKFDTEILLIKFKSAFLDKSDAKKNSQDIGFCYIVSSN